MGEASFASGEAQSAEPLANAPLSTSCDSLLTFEAENMKTVPDN